MKRTIFLIMLTGIILFGCSDSTTNVPIPSTKNSVETFNNLGKKSSDLTGLLSVTQLINGDVGGTMQLNRMYYKGNSLIIISGTIEFPKGAFNGQEEVTATTNDSDASITFLPHINFDKQVSLDLTFIGLNLEVMGFLEKQKVDFAFISDDNSIEIIKNNGVIINFIVGELSVKNAKLNHFSRYAFIK